MVSMRKKYGEALLALGHENPAVVALSADVSNSDHSYMFAEAFPDRFFNVGIAEQSLVDVAVGFACTDRIPFANTFAFLFATRALEMIRTHLCYGGANVKLMGGYAGLSDSFDGPTHHSITDIAIMRSLPGMRIVVPSDPDSLQGLLRQMAEQDGPFYCRLSRNESPVIYGGDYEPVIGKAHVARDGRDLTIIACGLMVSRALDAASRLEKDGVSVRVLDMHTIKPLDKEAILAAAEETGAILTCEEHSIVGGLGGAVAEVLGENRPTPLARVGLDDQFAETGPYDEILEKYGLGVGEIVRRAQGLLGRKGRPT